MGEDRIAVRPWVALIDGRTVTFTDWNSVDADAIVVATGFDLNLPFLSDEIRRTVDYSRTGMSLAEFTFHPSLDGFAFVGLWAQLGPYAVPLEQQARWIAYSWGGVIPAPSCAQLEHGVQRCIEEDHNGGYREQHEMAIRFGRLAGVDPEGVDDSEHREILPRAAVTPEMFRLVGPDSDSGARRRVLDDFWRYAPPNVKAEVSMRLGRGQA